MPWEEVLLEWDGWGPLVLRKRVAEGMRLDVSIDGFCDR